MARIRSIKPEFWSDLSLAQLSRDARLLYIAAWNQADEWGRLHGDPRWIKGHCLPYDDDLNLSAINGLLEELSGAGKVVRYVVAGAPYLYLPKLSEHQRLEPDKVPSRLPAPDEDDSAPDPPPSGRGADKSARDSDEGIGAGQSHDSPSTRNGADKSARNADKSEPNVALHVAGSRLQVAGSRVPTTSAAIDRTIPQRANDLANGYVGQVPLSKHQAVAAILRRALENYPDSAVALALARLISDNRGLTYETLRRELDGPPRKASTTDQRVGAALDLAARYEAEGR